MAASTVACTAGPDQPTSVGPSSAPSPAADLTGLSAGPTSSNPADPSPAASAQLSTSGSASTDTPSAGRPKLYVSIGDSYAAGYQPTGPKSGATSRNGFAYQVVTQSQQTASPLELANFGCSGATSNSLVSTVGCTTAALGPDGIGYPKTTQAAAALAYLNAHPGEVGLVTIVIGGNDVKACLTDSNPQHCVESALPVLRRNLAALTKAVRAAVGPTVAVVGLTYPDVFLGLALKGDAASITLAKESLVLFRSYLNPILSETYQANGARFVDVTAATGAYGSVTATRNVPPYGTIPVPVAQICTLTFFCQYQDIHPRTAGYQLIATLVTKEAGR